MKIENLESLQGIQPNAWRRLINFFESVEAGQPVNYVTPFLPKKARGREAAFAQELLKMASTDIQQLQTIEERETEKFGPFSLRDPWELRRPLVEEYFHQVEVKSSISLRKAWLQLAKLIPAHSLRALSLDESYKLSPKGKNLGLPHFSSSKTVELEYLKRAKRIAASGYKNDAYPAVVGWRGQPNGSTVSIKNRTVWMSDHAETYISTGVIQPALEALRHKPGFAAWNDLEYVDRRVTQIIDRARAPIVSVDFSGYDQSLPSTVIRLAFDLLRFWFVVGDKARIDWMERDFLESGLATPDGIYTERDGGVPSGKGSTNFVDSLAQLLTVLAAGIDLGINWLDIEVLGDDGIWSPDQLIDVERLSSYYEDLYGMKVSEDKGGFSLDHVMFLQRLHDRRYRKHGICVGIRSIVRTLNGVMHLERLHKGLKPQFFSARAIMQAENAKNHPNFRKLVSYLYQQDKFMRSLDPVEIFEQAGGVGMVEDVLGLRSYRFGTQLPSSGLEKFETVIELRRLRGEKRKRAA